MRFAKLPFAWLWAAVLSAASAALAQPVYINEVCFNPPNADSPHEYIELRGLPSYVLPAGTYFVAVDGDFSANTNPGLIQNVFDLSGRQFGTNGILVLLQKGHFYSVNPRATAAANSGSGPGWGSGASSSIRHEGEGGKTELDNASVTFFLIRSSFAPDPDDDIDANDDGTPDGPFLNWTVHDAVGLLDATGPGDCAYGLINYRRNAPPGNGASASGTVVPVAFTAVYAGRNANSVGWLASDWVACNNLSGTTPPWNLHPTETSPSSMVNQPLNHVGGPNWGGGAIRGLSIHHTGGHTEVAEGGGTDTYSIALNNAPSGNVVVQINAPPPLQISIDGGVNFFSTRSLTFNNINPQNVMVRAQDDNVVDMSPYLRHITHAITSTADANFPVGLALAASPVQIIDNDLLLLGELKVNPPGEDAPFEFVEVRGPPNALITNVQFIALDGSDDGNPGMVQAVVNLTSHRVGANGLLLLVGPGHGYSPAAATTVITVPAMGTAGGALGNDSASFILLGTRVNLSAGMDLDRGDNGVAEGLPVGATIMDAVGWRETDADDVVYGGVTLVDGADAPQAAARFSGNNTPLDAAAWFFGELESGDGRTLAFDETDVSANFPFGTMLSPGQGNNTAPQFTALLPMSGAIGDPTNPRVHFSVSDLESPAGNITIIASSTNQAVIPDGNLTLTTTGNGQYTLALTPVGVGYSLINLTASDGLITRRVGFRYAASEQCALETRFHFWTSDASTAMPIDANYMFVGDDENQVIRVYSRTQSGPPMQGFDFTPFLGLTDIENGRPREVDIEASTRAGNRIYWMGAHSHANIAEGRTNRSRIFGTDWSGSGPGSTLSYVGRYDYLKLDLVNWDVNNGHGKGANYYGLAASTMEGVDPKAPDGSGFNIEGLTMAPNSSTIGYVAFRAPIVPAANRTHALIVPVLNFATVAVGNLPQGSAVFGAPIELDLYGRGIRSIERAGTDYLIVAGIPGDNVGEYPQDFRLYTWTGNPADKPQERATNLRGLNPEGIVELPTPPWAPESIVHLMSDSGRRIWYNDGVTAKDMPIPNFKKFRTDPVPLGSIIKTSPIITFLEHGAAGFTIGWRSIRDERYRVEYKPSFAVPQWTALPGDVIADGTYASKTDPTPLPSERFYRVLVLP